MRRADYILIASVLLVGLALCLWIVDEVWRVQPSSSTMQTPDEPSADVLHLGLIPERDIFAQRERYSVLAEYLGKHIGRPVELAMSSTYAGVLEDFSESQIDMAFLGSLVAELSIERYGTRVIVKPVDLEGRETYRGVIFVRESSEINEVEDLAGRSIAMVKATTAGELFPLSEFVDSGLWQSRVARPRIEWLATHDDVVARVHAGLVDAGAAKDTRLDAFLETQPDAAFRRLAVSEEVPSNALVVRSEFPEELATSIRNTLLSMHETEEGRTVLQAFGAKRFVPCVRDEYSTIPEMINRLGEAWYDLGLTVPPPIESDRADADSRDER